MLDSLIESWQRQREGLLLDLDCAVLSDTPRHQVARIVKRIAKLDNRISTAVVLRRRYASPRTPTPTEHALAIAVLLTESGT